jgi:hypothetical protein
MTAPLLSPVRWWRDDATRYVTRGPQLVPGALRAPWMFELLARPADPGLQRLLDTYADLARPGRLAEMCAIPAELLYSGPGDTSGTGVAINEYRARLGVPPL